MVEASKDIDKGIKSVGVLATLFGEEFGVFAEDGLDGSEEELKIFKEVFYGASGCDAADEDKPAHARQPLGLNCGSSVLTSFSSRRDSSHGQASENTEVKSLSTVHQEKKSTDADLLRSDPSKVIVHSTLEDFVREELLCHVNGYCMFRSQREADASGNLDNGVKSKYKCRIQPVSDVNIVDGKSVTSPNSQESVASGLVATSAAFAPAETPGALICIKESVQESANLAIAHAVPKRRSSRDPLPLLESYAHCLLVDAGWKIESRTRIDRKKPGYCFTKPEGGRALKALTAAWKACGELLLLTSSDSEQDENGREWTDVNMFWKDLTDTLAYIDKTADHQDNSLSLLHRWQVLDPFMAMVWIDRKVGALRAGTAFKAANSTTFVLSQSNKTILPDMIAQRGNSISGELSLCSSGSLTSRITPLLQKSQISLVLEGSCDQQTLATQACNDIHSSKRCIRAEWQCPCCTELPKRSIKSLARRIGKGLLDEFLEMGSKGSGSRRKRSKRSASRSTFMQNDSVYSFYCHTEQENLCTLEETFDLSADVNSRKHLLDRGNTPDAVRLVNTRSEMQPFTYMVSPHGDSNMALPVYQDMTPVLQEYPNSAENIFCTQATNSKLMRTSAPKIVDGPTKKVRKKSKKIAEIEVTGVSDQCVHDNSGEAFALNAGGSTCDMVGLLDHLERTDSVRMESSSQCFEQLDDLEEHMDDFQHALSIEQVHAPAEIDILKKPSDTKANLWGKKKNSDLTLPVNHTLSKEDTKHNTLMKGECKAKRLNFHRSSSTSSTKQKLEHESNKAQIRINDHEISADEHITPRVFPDKNISDEVLEDGASPELKSDLNIMKDSNPEGKMKTGGKRPRRVCIKDDELLITTFFKKKYFGSSGKSSASKARDSQGKGLGKLKNEKGSCRLLPRALRKGGKLTMDGNQFVVGPRTILCWLIEMGSVSVKDTVQFRNPKNDAVVKDGWVTREGILCNCCSKILYVSEFNAHAGFKHQRPPLSLFLQSDKPYTLCQLQAWSTEYKVRKSRMQVMGAEVEDENDDTCARCADGGDLVCCDNWPSTYHQSCLSAQELPEGSWYCPNCVCMSCGDVADGKEASNSLSVFECSQCRNKYHETCIKRRLPCNVELGSSEWFCGESCQEIYMGFRSRVGVVNHIDDGFAWTILRCSHVDQKVGSKQKIAVMAECNSKLAIALTLMEECFVPMVDPRTGIDMIPHVLYNSGSKFARLDYQGFYAVVLEKGDVLVSVASIRLHGVTVAEMPLIATCSDHRRKGMCRLLLNAIEKLLISVKVKMLVLTAIPSLVETWMSGFGFELIEDEGKQQLTNVNLMKFPGTVLLKKNLREDSADRSVANVDLQSTEDQSQINLELPEMANTSFGKPFSENHQSDPSTLSLLPGIVEVPVKQFDGGQHLSTTYGENYLSTTWHSDREGGSIEDSSVRIENFKTDRMGQSFLSEKTVATQVCVANVSTIVHSCFGSLPSIATNGIASSNPIFNNYDVVTMDMEDKTSQEASTFADDADAVAVSNKRVSPGGDEKHKVLVDASSEVVICVSDRQTEGDPHLATINQVLALQLVP